MTTFENLVSNRRFEYAPISGGIPNNILQMYSDLEKKIFDTLPTCGVRLKAISFLFISIIGALSAVPYMGAAHALGGDNVPLQYTLLVGAGIGFTALSTWAWVNLLQIVCPATRLATRENDGNFYINCCKTTAFIIGLLGLSAIAAISEYSIGYMTYYYNKNPMLPDLSVSPVIVGICNMGLPLYSLCLLGKKTPRILHNIEDYIGFFWNRIDTQLDKCCEPDMSQDLCLQTIEKNRLLTISRLKCYKIKLLSFADLERSTKLGKRRADPEQTSLLNDLIHSVPYEDLPPENLISKVVRIFFQCIAMIGFLGALTFRGVLSYEGVNVISNSFLLKVFVVATSIFSTLFVTLHVAIRTIKSIFSYFEYGSSNLGLHFHSFLMCVLSSIILTIAGLSITSIIQVIKDFYGFDVKALKIIITVAASFSFFTLIGNALFDFISFLTKELIRYAGLPEAKECLEFCEKIDKLIDAVDNSNEICKTVSAFINQTEVAVGNKNPRSAGGSREITPENSAFCVSHSISLSSDSDP